MTNAEMVTQWKTFSMGSINPFYVAYSGLCYMGSTLSRPPPALLGRH